MNRPVICQLVHGLPVGGTEVLVDRLVRRLADRYEFVIVCLDEVGELGQQLARDGVEVVELGRRPGFDWACIRRLARWLHTSRPQLVHAHQYTPYAYAAATRLLGRRPRLVFTEHGRFFPDVASNKRRWFNRLMSRKNDRLIAVGGSVRQALIDVEGLPGDQIDVIYNGIVHDAAALSAEEVLGVRQELGFSEEHLLVVQVARLDPIKDHSTALRAIQLACRQCPNLRYAIVGDGPERPTVERLIDEFGLRDRVAVLGQRRDVPRLLAAADVFLLTSLSEGIPVTVIEAMAAGLPVVSTNVGGVPEVIDKNAHTLTPAGDAVALAYLLVRLAGDRGWRETLADVGRRRAAEYFAENRMIRQYDQIYHDVIDRREWTPRVAQFSAS